MNQLKTLSKSYLAAPASLKHEIAEDIFLNLKILDGKVASGSVKEPFQTMLEKTQFHDGGRSSRDLEPVFEKIFQYPSLSKTLDKISLMVGQKPNLRNITNYDKDVVY